MIFKPFFEPQTCTYSYFLGCEHTRRRCLIDPIAR